MHFIWHDMFVLGVPVAEKVLRPLIVYAFLIVGLRMAGKRELAQLNPFDLVVLLTLSNTVQNAIIGDDNTVVGGLIGAATLLVANYLVVRFLFAHDRLEKLVEGDSDILIDNGVVREDHLKKELLKKHQLETAAHRQGFGSTGEVERAVLEPGGSIYFVGKKPSSDETQQSELLKRLDAISATLGDLRSRVDKLSPS
ncbi:MAG: YetF domain-containing protein [Acidobacteriota bacterium]|jgi:uncharacterized membrane protein YcaP (DUF421 family)